MIFISHSTANDSFVNKLADELRIYGFQTWVDHQDMPAGSRWVAQLESALAESDVMLLVLSEASLSSSYVESEWHTFFNMGRKIIPLRLDNCILPLFLRTFHQVDFRRPECFHEAVAALLHVLPQNLEKTLPSNPLHPRTPASTRSMSLNHEEILCIAQEIIDNQALTMRAGTVQFILPKDDTILQFPLIDDMIIGRSHRSAQFQPDIDLNIYANSSMISRRHASLRREGDTLCIKDLSSSNGTFLGDIALPAHEYIPLENYSLIFLSHHFPLVIRYQF